MKNIFFLGCGKMGSIILHNLLEENTFKASQINILKRSEDNKISGLNYVKDISELPKNYKADLVFITIKPQDAAVILENFAKAKILNKKTIFVSILAGKKIQFFEKIFGNDAKIVRSMPNLPIQYSQGIFPYLSNKNIKKLEIEKLKTIFDKFGSAFKISNEKLFDAATAIFGSGPAYIFLLQEIFAEIAINCGIKKSESENLVKRLFLGSALMSEFSKKKFSQLRESVTSKNGTTASAIKALQKNSALKNIFTKAIDAAIIRSQEISRD
jgi:pyrroline-5-carboxylate reductase